MQYLLIVYNYCVLLHVLLVPQNVFCNNNRMVFFIKNYHIFFLSLLYFLRIFNRKKIYFNYVNNIKMLYYISLLITIKFLHICIYYVSLVKL